MKQNDSSMWKDLLNFKHLYLQGRIMMTDNGDAIDLWNEAWFGILPLINKFPQLFDMCITKLDSGRSCCN
jgi:hypothetical protein